VKTPHKHKRPRKTAESDGPDQPARVPGRDAEEHASFARRLRAVADQLGGVRALANSAGVFESTVHAWLRSAEPSRNTLKRIANAANVSLDWLISGENYARLRFYDLRNSQGFNEVFLARDREQRREGKFETRLFDLSALAGPLASQNERLGIARSLETWQSPARAQANLFMMLVGGSGDAMAPLIRDSNLTVVAEGCGTGADYRPGRSVTYPCVLSHRGRIVIRLIRNEAHATAIGPIEKSSWPPTMGKPDYLFDGTLFAAGELRSPDGEFFMLGRVIWCGGSLLGFNFS
jgi:transcriptional regulator with XRE-family HTH domain